MPWGAMDDPDTLLDVVLVELSMNVRQQLKQRTPRTRRTIVGFGESLDQLPSSEELRTLVNGWLEDGVIPRLEEYHTAREGGRRGAARGYRTRHLGAAQIATGIHGSEIPNVGMAHPTGPVRPSASPAAIGAKKQRMEELLAEMKGQVNLAPRRVDDEP